MTKERKLESRIAELEAQLERMQDQQIDFVRSVSHSLKNSLGLVNNFARMAQMDGVGTADDSLQDSLNTVLKNGKMALHIVEELRLWGAVQNGATFELDSWALRPILSSVWEHCDDLVHFGRASLNMDEMNTYMSVLGDKALIKQAILTVVSYLLGRGERPNEIICVSEEKEGRVRLTLSGDFDRELDLSTLFVESGGPVKTDGYGIGLPFAQQVMHLMGGEISCEGPANGRLGFVLSWDK